MSDKIKQLKKEMIICYGLKCWLCGIEDKKLTAHHIIPVRERGETIWENIALLNRKQHDLFNCIENINPNIAKELNWLFYELNRTYAPPTTDYYDEVDKILRKVK